MKFHIFFAILAIVVASLAQGVTDQVKPPGDAPAGSKETYNGRFEISIVNIKKKAKMTKRFHPLKGRGTHCPSTSSMLQAQLKDGVLTDARGRTGYIASNYQFQFDNPPQAGAIYTAGFSVCANRSLALGSSAVFWECKSGDFWNLYDRNWAEQCSPVDILVLPCEEGGAEAAEPAPAAPGETETAPAPTEGGGGEGPTETVVGTQTVTSTVVVPLEDGQPQVITTTTVIPICQIDDGQVQGHTTPCTGEPAPEPTPEVTNPPVSQIPDGQIQVPPSSEEGEPVSQIPDGQIQVPPAPEEGEPAPQIPDGQIQVTPGPETGAPEAQPTGSSAPPMVNGAAGGGGRLGLAGCVGHVGAAVAVGLGVGAADWF